MFGDPIYSLVRLAWKTCGIRAPIVLARYATLTCLNRTSRQRRINRPPNLRPNLSRTTFDREVVETPNSSGPLGDVIIPVYNNFEDTRALLKSLSEQGVSIGKIIVVNDCSTDRRVAPLIRSVADSDARIVILENPANLGFVHACNRGLSTSGRDCVILNTDIELPPSAITRLLHVLQSSKKIATVTPFSNCAYATGVPDLNYRNSSPFGASTAKIDACFQALRPLAPIDLPRGVGFCMAMSRTAINRLGPFRECFGQGYGEEADFCLRAWDVGLRSVLAPHVYVFHRGGQSFGDSATSRAREGAIRLLALHPGYVWAIARYLQGGEARAVSFAAMALLTQRISGRDIVRIDLTKSSVSHERASVHEPELLLEKDGDGVAAILRMTRKEYRFRFANAPLFEQTLSLLPTSQRGGAHCSEYTG